ncbi:hypothetical protein [Rhizorhabdus sp. FW153]|uniref:hypothetical protein n=1 Tax=Rhizorhabdus sp. FW153 TaxID=3400216 RepID=UPI003CF15CFA
MAAKSTLSELRNGIQDIYHEVMREQGNGEVSNAAVLSRVRVEQAEALSSLAPALVNIALTKLLNDVSSRKRGKSTSSPVADLFGEYRVPGSVTLVRGKKKDTAKLTFREAELYVKARAEKSVSDRHEPWRQLLEVCRDHVKSEDDTLEILIARVRQANSRKLDL